MALRPLILVDSSHLALQRYFASIAYFRHQGFYPKPNTFQRYYEESLRGTIASLPDLVPLPNPEIVFAVDSFPSWRKQVYGGYKKGRDRPGHVLSEFTRRLLPTLEGTSITFPRAEADDIIGALHYTNRYQREIRIVSNDSDFLQLYDSRTRQFALKKNATGGIFTEVTSNLPGDTHMWHKVLMGDRADTIPGVKRGVGYKRALAIVTKGESSLPHVLKWVKENDCEAEFMRNYHLIALTRDYESQLGISPHQRNIYEKLKGIVT